MKRLLLFLAALTLLSGCGPKKTIEGTWKGNISGNGMSLPLVVTITKDSGKFTGDVESPSQKKGVKFSLDSVTLQDDAVQLSVPTLNGAFDGKLSADGMKLEGTWKQTILNQKVSLPLTLTKGDAASNG